MKRGVHDQVQHNVSAYVTEICAFIKCQLFSVVQLTVKCSAFFCYTKSHSE